VKVKGKEELFGICVYQGLLNNSSFANSKRHHCLITGKRTEEGTNGIIPSKLARSEKRFFKCSNGHGIFVAEGTQLTDAENELESNTFPLNQLPKAIWPTVLVQLETNSLLFISLVCKDWKSHVEQDAHWKLRSENELTWLENVEKHFSTEKQKNNSLTWREFFKESLWEITIHEIFSGRGGSSITATFKVRIRPDATVQEFLKKCKENPANPQRHRMEIQTFYPHDPSRIGKQTQQGIVSNSNESPNCTWSAKSETLVRDSGLCNGAVLAMSSLKCD